MGKMFFASGFPLLAGTLLDNRVRRGSTRLSTVLVAIRFPPTVQKLIRESLEFLEGSDID